MAENKFYDLAKNSNADLMKQAYVATGGQGAMFNHDDQGNVYVDWSYQNKNKKNPIAESAKDNGASKPDADNPSYPKFDKSGSYYYDGRSGNMINKPTDQEVFSNTVQAQHRRPGKGAGFLSKMQDEGTVPTDLSGMLNNAVANWNNGLGGDINALWQQTISPFQDIGIGKTQPAIPEAGRYGEDAQQQQYNSAYEAAVQDAAKYGISREMLAELEKNAHGETDRYRYYANSQPQPTLEPAETNGIQTPSGALDKNIRTAEDDLMEQYGMYLNPSGIASPANQPTREESEDYRKYLEEMRNGTAAKPSEYLGNGTSDNDYQFRLMQAINQYGITPETLLQYYQNGQGYVDEGFRRYLEDIVSGKNR